jgi:hypothetical protein
VEVCDVKNTCEEMLAAAKLIAQARGYAELNFRDLAKQVGIKAASILSSFLEQSRPGQSSGEALLGGRSGLS